MSSRATRICLLMMIGCLFVWFAAACSDPGEFDENDAGVTHDDAGDIMSDTDPIPDATDTNTDDGGDATDTAPDAGPCGGSCSGTKPVCDEQAGECVACLVDVDCSIGVCNPATNECVTCYRDGQCQAGAACDPETDTCVDCLTSDDCSDGNVCDTTQKVCVGCLDDGDCADGLCDTTQNACVECLDDSQCTEATKARCDTSDHTCKACDDSAQCANVTGASICVQSGGAGTCVECTVDDESACNGNSCDPQTNTCTNTPTQSVETCGQCQADSECKAGYRCVPMKFQGADLPGGYCLMEKPSGGCHDNPYSQTITRDSLSGYAGGMYCGINEQLTTCDAVRDRIAQKHCTTDAECGLGSESDGKCVPVIESCTYSCDSDSECPGVCTQPNGYCSP